VNHVDVSCSCYLRLNDVDRAIERAIEVHATESGISVGRPLRADVDQATHEVVRALERALWEARPCP